ncbi:hypothetical protein Tco_1513674 [Tanacetum coccineum]
MLKELKNSATMLQRMMEKVLADQRGRNVEIYLEEIVIKSKSELDLVQDVEETLRKLKRVNIKIDLATSSFGVEEGRFLGHTVTKEGVRADTEKVHAIILSPTPKSPNQIRNLFLQLTVISKFIPKMAELPYPIRMVRVRSEATEGSGWTYEAEEALQRIKRKLNKLQTLAVTKEGEIRMLCLCHKGETISSVLLETLDENERGTSNLNKELQAKSTPTPRAWWLYLGKETIEEGFGVGIILVSPEERMHSYAILLKFNTSDYANDCEALLAGLAVSVPAHTPSENFELQSRGVDMIGNHKVGIPQSRSIDVYQNKTIGGRDKQQQEGKSNEQCAKCKTKL